MGRFRQLRRALRGSVGHPAAFQARDGFGATLIPLLEGVIRGDRVRDRDIYDMVAAEDGDFDRRQAIAEKYAKPLIVPGGRGGKATAVVSMRGVALYDVEYQPLAFSTQRLEQTVSALTQDPEIGAIILDVDSPGGLVTGVPEAADAIFRARQTKKVGAIVNPLAASAAYWLASQASEIVAVPSGYVGSIGVFMLHADCSGLMEEVGVAWTFIHAGENKVEGNSFEPLSESARAFFQSEVDTVYRNFLSAVARGRDVTSAKVEAEFGQGRTFMAEKAKRLGMVDRLATPSAALARFGVVQPGTDTRRAENVFDDDPEAVADDPEPTEVVADEDGDSHLETEEAVRQPAPNLTRQRRLAILRNS